MRIGFTGTKIGMTPEQKQVLKRVFYAAAQQHSELELHHGDCVGADSEAHDIYQKQANENIVIHPPLDDKARAWCLTSLENLRLPKPYLARNHDIVD